MKSMKLRESAVHDKPKPVQKHTQQNTAKLSLLTESQKMLKYDFCQYHSPLVMTRLLSYAGLKLCLLHPS